MSDIKLFRTTGDAVSELEPEGFHLEKSLQALIERHLETFVGVRFLATEYSTGARHAGRIDTLGLDENHCPVILEYKRSSSENVINQGLFYLDWLMDHQAEFKLLVLENFGKEAAAAIDWSAPRLICIAADFTKYDGHAVQQINRNIELIRYRRFGKDLLLLELANAVTAAGSTETPKPTGKTTKTTDKSVAEWLADLPPSIEKIFDELDAYLRSLGDDVQRKDLKLYIAFKRLRNFATVVFQAKMLRVYLHVNPDDYTLEEGFLRDVRSIGHWGTGDLELMIDSLDDLEKAKPYLNAAYGGGSA
jgi:predicted transport protein